MFYIRESRIAKEARATIRNERRPRLRPVLPRAVPHRDVGSENGYRPQGRTLLEASYTPQPGQEYPVSWQSLVPPENVVATNVKLRWNGVSVVVTNIARVLARVRTARRFEPICGDQRTRIPLRTEHAGPTLATAMQPVACNDDAPRQRPEAR